MSKNKIISDEKSSRQNTLKKVGSDFIGGLSTISVSDMSSSKFLKSTGGSVFKESKSDITSFMKVDPTPKKIKSVTLVSASKKSFHKQEISKSIVDKVMNNVEESCALCTSIMCNSHREESLPAKLASKLITNAQDLKEEFRKGTSSQTTYKHQEKDVDKSNKRMIKSVVQELELPITFPKTKDHVEGNPKFEQLLLDTHVSKSSLLTSESKDKCDKTMYESISHSSEQSGISEEIINDKTATTSPFDLCWCFGFNPEVPILNLSNNESSQIVFANSQYAVLYDFHEEKMSFMQGHLNTMTCLSMTVTGSIIATADSSSEVDTSRVIIWDSRPYILQVLDNAHPYGCQKIALSSNGEFLVTVSANEVPVCIKVWEWKKGSKDASVTLMVKESLGSVKRLTIHSNLKHEFAVTFERSVIFAHVTWQIVLHESGPEKRTTETEIIKECMYDTSVYIPSKLGNMTDTTFPECEEATALSSTSKGYVIVWENSLNNKLRRNYKKYVRLHLDCITSIQTVDNKIAVATISGNVSFYDLDLTILYFHKLREPIVSLSFNVTTQKHDVKTCDEHNSCANLWRNEPTNLVDATLKKKPFSARHFVFSTEAGRIAYFNVSCGNPKYLMFSSKSPFTALDMLPNGKFLCAGTASGQCILFDTEQHKAKVTQQIKVAAESCQAVSYLQYSPSGNMLACAMYTGEIWVLDPLLLTPKFDSPLDGCSYCITQMKYTSDSEYLIVVDVSFCISLYFVVGEPKLIGQYIGHYKPIVKILVVPLDGIGSKDTLVLTISQDRSLCAFKIDTENKTFEYLYNLRIEQTSIPMYSVYYPYPCPDSSAGWYLGINDEYKFRMSDLHLTVSVKKAVGKMRGKLQAPDFGSPIDYMHIFLNSGNYYLFFKTKNHIGIHLLPIDGNPYRALGFRASPTDLTCCRVHPNGQYVFTISEFCSGISMWKVNTQAVEDFYKSGGEGLEPFLRVLGKKKENDIIDFFELGQFLHQGESPNVVRTLKNSLPICEVANVLQALGCLLSKGDIQEITNELINRDLENPNYNIEYEDFVRLYFNHRSIVELKVKDLKQAFRHFYEAVNSYRPETVCKLSEPIFDTASFIEKLQETGEELSRQDLINDFTNLMGGQQNKMSKDDNDFEIPLPSGWPKEISFETFVKVILGFSVDNSVFEE